MQIFHFYTKMYLRRKIFGGLLLLPLLFSCNPDDAGIPPGLIDPNDTLNASYSDTATVWAYIEKDDTVRTDVTRYALLGVMNDPVFGITRSEFFTTVGITQEISSYGVTPVLDSVVLVLRYVDSYGAYKKFGGLQTVQVFEMLDELVNANDNTNGYNSYTQVNYDPVPIATQSYVGLFPTFASEGRQMRIKLSNSLGQRFLDAGSLTTSNIKDLLKGFYVTNANQSQSPGQGAISRFDLLSDVSRMSIYYHDTGNTKREVKLQMRTNTNARFNRYYHQYPPGGDIAQKLASDSTYDYTSSPVLYMQSLEGIRLKFKLPYLKDYVKDGQVGVNRAEILIPVDQDQDFSLYPIPLQTNPYELDDQRKVDLLIDVSYEFDGKYNGTQKYYRVLISQHLQHILNDQAPNDWIYVDFAIGTRDYEALRVVLNGPKHPVQPMKLRLIYTPLEKIN